MLLGDGTVPVDAAATITVPAVLDGGDSADYKHVAVDTLARVLPNARRETLTGQSTMVPPEVLAPLLRAFFTAKP